MTGARRSRPLVHAALVGTFVMGAALVLGTGNAQAAGYRYWSFWEGDGGAWTYATQGPATALPADGTAVGFRFAVSTDSADASRPRDGSGFAAICGATPEEAGRKRVAVVVDYGTAADAPDGERPPAPRAGCARLGEDATAAEALAAVAKPLRYDADALLCAISGYPESGCGEQVADGGTNRTDATAASMDSGAPASSGAPAPTEPGSHPEPEGDSGPSVGLVAGAAAVLVLTAAALRRARRRRE
ncbi:SCO2322 family protein [Streptomyces odonnellii]|uniref:SCO2322 family protein n=1 Tax=Streptomyces odonnellii TaxID=1417980 RepID=UPI000A7F741E|nr:SCO2322 family protein [Streptomyces odonnellii]